MTPDFDSILLLAYGGPTGPDEIRPFLDGVLRGRPVPPARYEQVVRNYLAVGGASPIARLTLAQADGLRAALADGGPELPVYVGMRHWHPFIADTLRTMAGEGRRRAAGIILAPHPSEVSREGYTRAVDEARARIGADAPAVDYVPDWSEHALFVEAVADRLAAAIAAVPEDRRRDAALVFTAHSIPVPMARASGYADRVAKTAALVCRRLGLGVWSIAWQSRSGNPADPWLEPDILDHLKVVAGRGARDVVVAPIGFVTDHVEVLYDLDIAAREAARGLGLGFHRAGTVGDHPAFMQLLAHLVRQAVRGAA
jgi:ferrochelatase